MNKVMGKKKTIALSNNIVLKYGYASAISVILMVLCMMAVGISNAVYRTENDGQVGYTIG